MEPRDPVIAPPPSFRFGAAPPGSEHSVLPAGHPAASASTSPGAVPGHRSSLRGRAGEKLTCRLTKRRPCARSGALEAPSAPATPRSAAGSWWAALIRGHLRNLERPSPPMASSFPCSPTPSALEPRRHLRRRSRLNLILGAGAAGFAGSERSADPPRAAAPARCHRGPGRGRLRAGSPWVERLWHLYLFVGVLAGVGMSELLSAGRVHGGPLLWFVAGRGLRAGQSYLSWASILLVHSRG
jgi:hypothetical protein